MLLLLFLLVAPVSYPPAYDFYPFTVNLLGEHGWCIADCTRYLVPGIWYEYNMISHTLGHLVTGVLLDMKVSR